MRAKKFNMLISAKNKHFGLWIFLLYLFLPRLYFKTVLIWLQKSSNAETNGHFEIFLKFTSYIVSVLNGPVVFLCWKL